MLVIGIALLASAAILAPMGFLAYRRWQHRHALATLCPRAFVALAGHNVTLHGRAATGPAGTVESRLAGVECVWHGHEVIRHYTTWRTVEETGERQQVLGDDRIADYSSPELFALIGPDGSPPSDQPILVDPEEADTTRVNLCLQRVVSRPQRGVPAPADDLLGRIKGRVSGIFRGETLEFEYRERAIRAGDPLIVRGRVELREGHPVLVAPEDGRLSIEHSTTAPPPVPGPPVHALLLSGSALLPGIAGLLLLVSS